MKHIKIPLSFHTLYRSFFFIEGISFATNITGDTRMLDYEKPCIEVRVAEHWPLPAPSAALTGTAMEKEVIGWSAHSCKNKPGMYRDRKSSIIQQEDEEGKKTCN